MNKTFSLFATILIFNLFTIHPANASPEDLISKNQVDISFPISLTFRANLSSNAKISNVVLEYGTNQLTCGDVIAKAFPQFTPANEINVQWTWEMRQSGSLPPGTEIWWQWRYIDENGIVNVTNRETVIWLDQQHDWKTVTAQKLNLHWYSGNQSFADDLLQSAVNGLNFNETHSGLKAEVPIDLYIYANTSDLKEAVLYEPSWTGGLAYPEHDIVIIGISPSDLDWGRDAVVHEITHVLVGHKTFSCLGSVPTWLNEGLAVYSEGELDSAQQSQLESAIQNDTLLSIRSLSSGFSEVSSKAYLSYSESFSVVDFLIKTNGQEKMNLLLEDLRDGKTIDEALINVYGFNVEGLEDAWRKDIGADLRLTTAQPTAIPTPTYVPTIVPISGAPVVMANGTPIPTSSYDVQPTKEPEFRGKPPLSLTLMLLCMCVVFLFLIGVIILGFVVRRGNKAGGKSE